MSKERFYITTAISYPNGKPHIGHAYELIATDAIARFMRLDGREVFFLTGTDEHGIKMLQTARKEGIEVRELADRNAERFEHLAFYGSDAPEVERLADEAEREPVVKSERRVPMLMTRSAWAINLPAAAVPVTPQPPTDSE